MAENESLDLMSKTSRRWWHLCQRIAAGASDEEVSNVLVRNMFKTFQNVQKQIPLDRLIDGAVACQDLSALVRECDGHDYARLVELEAQAFDTAQSLVERVVWATAEKFLHQIEMQVVGTEAIRDFRAFGTRAAAWKDGARAQLSSLATKLAENPAVTVRTPPRTTVKPTVPTDQIARISLVGSIQRASL